MSYSLPMDVEELSGYDREVVDRVWSLSQSVPGNDPALWRKDEHGAWMHRMEYGNRHSQFGWEIADCGSYIRRVGVSSLRAMQWQNYVDWMVACRNGAVMTADGLNNARRLL